ncbi:MAG: hypothetical protein FJW40_02990 [Acidobacteria bacterium]|nr:hypothetical protein [Acidobacteriota bacterium]
MTGHQRVLWTALPVLLLGAAQADAQLLSYAGGPATVVSGQTVTTSLVQIYLTAPLGGAPISVSSSNPAVLSVPSVVTIPEGANRVFFPITASMVAAHTLVTVTASTPQNVKTFNVTVIPMAVASVVVPPTSLGGRVLTASNLVILNGKAPAAGFPVTLASSNTAVVTVAPATLTVPAGLDRTNFTITTAPVAVDASATITATGGGITRSASITVTAPAPSSLTLGQTGILGGLTVANNRVLLNAAAPAGGSAITLASSDPAAVPVPDVLVIPAGATQGTFNIVTSAVAAPVAAIISATGNGVTRTATLTVGPLTLNSVTVSNASPGGGITVNGNQVFLNGPAPAGGVTVALGSSNPALIVPPSVLVPAGASSASFSFTTGVVAAATPVVITASFMGIDRTANVTVTPAALTLVTIPSSIVGGNSTATPAVTLSGIAPATGAVVALSSSNPAVASVPASVTVLSGATTATFTITTTAVTAATPVTITANYLGVNRTATINVQPVLISQFTASANTVGGRVTQDGNPLYLNGPAPPGGVTVTVTSSNPAALVAENLTIPEGSTSGRVRLTAIAVPTDTVVTVTATLGSSTKTANVTVKASVPNALLLSRQSIVGGTNTGSNRIILSGTAIAGGQPMTVTSSNPAAATAPATVTVAAGASWVDFNITTFPVTETTPVTFTVTYGAVSVTATANITPVIGLTSVNLTQPQATGPGTLPGNQLVLNGPLAVAGTVTLSSSNPSVASVPASVSIPANATSGTFTVTLNTVAAPTNIVISATYGGVTRQANLTVNPVVDLTTLTLAQPQVLGGTTLNGNSLGLNVAAFGAGFAVSLSSSNPSVASVPASVTVPSGASSALFSITTSPVAAHTDVVITATAGTTVRTVTLTVTESVTLTALLLAQPGLVGGNSLPGNQVILSGPAPSSTAVQLASSNPAAQTPAEVIVPTGQSSAAFTITSSVVTAPMDLVITATLGATSRTANLSLATPTLLSSISLIQASITGGLTLSGSQVVLTEPAPAGGYVVALASSNTAVATVPANVTVPAGATTATFTITTNPTASNAAAVITATAGSGVRSQTLTVTPPQLVSVTLAEPLASAQSSFGGNAVTLNVPAPASGTTVALSSSNAAVTVPASVVVPAGATTATFNISVGSLAANGTATITATLAGGSQTALLNLQVVRLSFINPLSNISSGRTSTINEVHLTGPAPAGGALVQLSVTRPEVFNSPPVSVLIPEGQTKASFTLT